MKAQVFCGFGVGLFVLIYSGLQFVALVEGVKLHTCLEIIKKKKVITTSLHRSFPHIRLMGIKPAGQLAAFLFTTGLYQERPVPAWGLA